MASGCVTAPWLRFSNWVNNSGNNSWQQYYRPRVLLCVQVEKKAQTTVLTTALLLSGIPAEVINRSMDTYRRMGDVFADLCVYFFTFIISHEILQLFGSETPWQLAGPNSLHFSPLFFFNLQQPAPCVSYFSGPWSFTPADLHSSCMGRVSSDSAVKMLISAALHAPVAVLKLRNTVQRELLCRGIFASRGRGNNKVRHEVESGAWRGNIHGTSII